MDSFSDEVPVSSFYNPPNITDEVDLLLPDVPHDIGNGPTDLADR